jgi:carbon-monoxide dehydrogenase large subunit
MDYHVIGQPVARTDNAGKVTGEARYTADVLLPGTLWAKTLRSPYSHARIIRIDTSRAEKAEGVRAVLTGKDVAGILYGRRYRDISILAQDRARFLGERIATVAADTLEQAERALELIDVHYEELPAVFDPEAALQEGAPIIHPDVATYKGLPKPLDAPTNRFAHDMFNRGDVDAGFARADVVVENAFTVARVHQAFLEPHCCLVWIDEQERVQMWSPNKAPQGLKESMCNAFKIAPERVCIHPVAIGGDFGGKGAPIDEPICYLLALRTGRPVKMIMEYREEFRRWRAAPCGGAAAENWRQTRWCYCRAPDGRLSRRRCLWRIQARSRRRRHRARGRLLPRGALAHLGITYLHQQFARRPDACARRAARIFCR